MFQSLIERFNRLTHANPNTRVLGLHIGNQNLVSAVFDVGPEGVTLANLNHAPVGLSSEQLPELLKVHLVSQSLTVKKVAVSCSRDSAIVRLIPFPKMEEKQLRTSLEFEAEKYLPFSLSEVYFDCQPIPEISGGGNTGQMKALLVACKRDVIINLINLIQRVNGRLDIVNLDSLATLNAFLRCFSKNADKTFVLLDVGTHVSNLSIVRGAKILFLRDISFSLFSNSKNFLSYSFSFCLYASYSPFYFLNALFSLFYHFILCEGIYKNLSN